MLEESRADTDAVDEILIALARVDVRLEGIVDVDPQIRVVEVITGLAEELDRTDRDRADDIRCETLEPQAIVAARTGRARAAVRLAKVDVCRFHGNVGIEPIADESLPRGIVI